ncbi:putative alpha-glucosidase [Frankia canadensis]|uniref:Putative alpha-glucosidase n=1 Tax=Frankia canadensis TaxID=1836972 RepID=A0A2I2KNK3_9ACTN|nr:glycoside hydrolase family 13 protein [Frankia canadensis]SNQ47240.1 putative alpha-glucosidase [Frankia canadensis]SOU54530.1 putative alpha-glucosidase [Frankia canadensis]
MPARQDAGTRPASGGRDASWWRRAVLYEVYLRSFADADGDGVGDLAGLRQHLPALAELGVDALWITPFYRSPMADHGYDVADHRDVDPLFGTLSDVDALLADAAAAGLAVLVDLVPNHSSSAHPAFTAALSAPPGDPRRDLYVFRDGRGAHGELPPNNWESVFGGPAWTQIADGQWYLHLFDAEQPDWNWSHPAVRADHEATVRFWLDRGVDGFRIDVSHGLVKDAELRDNPPGPPLLPDAGFRDEGEPRVWDQDGVHEIYRTWRAIADEYTARDGRPRILVGETWVRDPVRLARYVRPDELHLTFSFSLLATSFSAPAWRAAIDAERAALGAVGAPATWVLANHDVVRPVTRYGGGSAGVRRARAALLTLLALPGVAVLYQGDELALPQADVPPGARQDPVWTRSKGTSPGRDGARVPLPWSGDAPPYGFTAPGAAPWLPQPDDWAGLAVLAQAGDPLSTWLLVRGALALRRALPHLRGEELRFRDDVPTHCLAFDRPPPPAATSGGSVGMTCVMSTGQEVELAISGRLVLASGPVGYDGAVLSLPPDTTAWVAPWEG